MDSILFLLPTYTFTLRSLTILIHFLWTTQELPYCQVLDSALTETPEITSEFKSVTFCAPGAFSSWYIGCQCVGKEIRSNS